MVGLEQSVDALAHLAEQQEARADQAEAEADALARQHRTAEDALSAALEKLMLPPVPPTPVPPTPEPPSPKPSIKSDSESGEEGEGSHIDVYDREADKVVWEKSEKSRYCPACEDRLYLDQFDKWGENGRRRTKCRQCLSKK
jgi:hypothetical protein